MGLKILRILLIGYFVLSLNKNTHAQCPGGAAPQQFSQNIVTGINGDFEAFPFDQFDPALGTLTGVNIHAKVTGLIKMSVINYNTTPRSFNVEVGRTDYFTAPGLGVEIIVDTTVAYTTPAIPAAQYPGTAPTYSDRVPNDDGSNINDRYVSAPVNVEVNQTITDPLILANYSGGGVYTIDYELNPWYSVRGTGSSQTQASITTYSTQVELTVVYTYCPHSVLSGGKLELQVAKKTNDKDVLLTWTKEKEEHGILYTPEVSTNGTHFTALGNMQSQKPSNDATVVRYEFNYDIPVSSNGKLYFRVRQVHADGEITYSAIKTINADKANAATVFLYPNPADKAVTLSFAKPQKQNLQALVINSAGQTVENARIVLNGGQVYQFNFSKKHPTGVYFIKIVDPTNTQNQVVRLLIK